MLLQPQVSRISSLILLQQNKYSSFEQALFIENVFKKIKSYNSGSVILQAGYSRQAFKSLDYCKVLSHNALEWEL